MCLPRVSVIVIVLSTGDFGEGLLIYINVGDKSTMVARLPQQVFLLLVLVTGPTMGIGTYGPESPKSTRPSYPATTDESPTSVVRATKISSNRNAKNHLDENFVPTIAHDVATNLRAKSFKTKITNVATKSDNVDDNEPTNIRVDKIYDENNVANEFVEQLENSLTKSERLGSLSFERPIESPRPKKNVETWNALSTRTHNRPEDRRSLRIRETSVVSVLLSTADSWSTFETTSPASTSTSALSLSMTSSMSHVLSSSLPPTSFVVKSDIPTSKSRLRTTRAHATSSLSTVSPISIPTDRRKPENRIILLNEKFFTPQVRSQTEKLTMTNDESKRNVFHDFATMKKKLPIVESSTKNRTRLSEKKIRATTVYTKNGIDEMRRVDETNENRGPMTETSLTSVAGFGYSKRYMRDAADDNNCEKFEIGDPGKREFYSPNYPENYSPLTDCVLVLEAEKGMLLKLDFRERFELETRTPDGECRFDYLEVRDGQYGFSPRIGTYCDKTFPPEIISQSRYLWLNFHSDDTIEYQGFKAVWSTVPRPDTDTIPPEQDPCIYYEDIPADFELRSDMIKDAKKSAEANRVALDCLWVLKTGPSMKMQLTFDSFKLEKPNDCSANFLDIFDGQTDEPSRVKKFCGSIAEALSTRSETMYVRLYLEQKAINSSFSALITAVRDKDGNQACRDDEYDCDDATCIAESLKCNNRRNCRFQRDEDEILCGTSMENQDRSRIVIILVIFSLIMCGLCSAFLFNCVRKLKRDHRIIREHIRQSREDRLDEIGRRATPCPLSVSRTDLRDGGSESPAAEEVDSSKELIPTATITVREYTKELAMEMRYGQREMNDIHQSNNVSNATQERLQETTSEPDMCDNSCQTRESLFAPALIPDGIIPSSPEFSSFGYRAKSKPETTPMGEESPTDSNYRNHGHHHHHHHHHHHPHDYSHNLHAPSLRKISQTSQNGRYGNSQISEQSSGCSNDENSTICPKHNPIPAPPGWSFHETPCPPPHAAPKLSNFHGDNSSYRRYNSPKPDRDLSIVRQSANYHGEQFVRQNTVGSGERYGSFIYGSGRASSSNATTPTTMTTTTSTTTTSTSTSRTADGADSQSTTPKHCSTDPRYRAEAIIEVDRKRPFSMESTKSAPDVIATH